MGGIPARVPLSLTGGRAFAAAWAPIQHTVSQSVQNGVIRKHLASRGPDDGLQALCIDWAEVALLVAEMSLPRRNPAPRGRR